MLTMALAAVVGGREVLAASANPAGFLTSYDGLRSASATPSGRTGNGIGGMESRGGMRSWGVKVKAVATPARPPTTLPPKRSKVEIFKEQSDYLRYPLIEELVSEAPNLNEAGTQLIKFHGSYVQDNRDVRTSRQYQFMLRTKQPAGKVSNQLYLVMDDLANEFGSGTLRLTTRQTFQLHGVLKTNLKTVMATIIRSMGSTLGACGDLNRNVLAPPVPYVDRKDYHFAQETADRLAALLAPQAGAYYDLWVDGEKIASAEPPDVVEARNHTATGASFEGSPEPIYGTQFLPRKFKIAVTVPGDNSVDILTNDIGLVAIFDKAGDPKGFNIYVGGGMGRTHRNENTFPRLADPLGYVPKDDILYAVKAIVATQRDYGRRDDRRMSRMKYLIHDWGLERFKGVVEQYYGKKFEPFQELPPWEYKDYLGWNDQGDGRLFLGVHIDNGRIKGEAKKTLREMIEKYNLSVRLTANQNLILCDVRKAWKTIITKSLAAVGLVSPRSVDPLKLTAMACPALPLCPLAIAEAERGIPDVLKRIRFIFEKVGLKNTDSVVIRMTGCPNGCTRPYMAELGFVGDGANSYQVWLGGCPNQTRLAQVFMDKVKVQELETALEPLFYAWRTLRKAGEPFGDFSVRLGFDELRTFIERYDGPRRGRGISQLPISNDLFVSLKSISDRQGISPTKLAATVLSQYVESITNGEEFSTQDDESSTRAEEPSTREKEPCAKEAEFVEKS